jgi:PIN domain nuclease of toxin-antitoxin system
VGFLRFLLDTHCWLWLHWQPDRLPSPVKRRLRQGSNELVLSAVNVLEITIKQASGRLRLPQSVEAFVADLLASSVRPLPLLLDHAIAIGTLPPLHQDPFDRLLVAQALVEDLTLVTADAHILRYPARTLDARK